MCAPPTQEKCAFPCVRCSDRRNQRSAQPIAGFLAGDQKYVRAHVFDPNGTPTTKIPARSASRTTLSASAITVLADDDCNTRQPCPGNPGHRLRADRGQIETAGLDRASAPSPAHRHRQQCQYVRSRAARQRAPAFDPYLPQPPPPICAFRPRPRLARYQKHRLPANNRDQTQCLPGRSRKRRPDRALPPGPEFLAPPRALQARRKPCSSKSLLTPVQQMIVATTIGADDLRQQFYRQEIGTKRPQGRPHQRRR